MNLALFDFDGTITEQDTYTKFLFYVTPKRRLIITLLLASPFIALYKLGLLKPSKTRPLLSRIVFWNSSVADITRLARSFSEQYLPSVIRAEALAKIEWHKAQGDEVYVVSASLGPYISCWCLSKDIKWVCSELETKNNKLTGRYVSGDCSLENKVSAIKRQVNLSDFKTIYAYGDTAEDMPMLALAHEKYFNWQRVID
ncbi:HAD-IB family hydrolase [Idiomarina aminovorans]|uniref:HAD-IB family hydrolase n=1 Tax=Idiomarina aminovorans TaxID=2914829 RepID=UPI0020053E32|nr:HAD-IB family hydrolase [Idiomarina sp. ATCH4]MCK7460147.1 HAD-IB family hydrolase [Idiomarina sp. ATCH4]